MLRKCPEISCTDCEESLFDIIIKLSKKRIYARLQSSKWKKPRRLRAVTKNPLTERLLASSKTVLKTSTTRENKNKLQAIAHEIKKLHELYLEMEKAKADVDIYFIKQTVRQASRLSAPAPSLEAALIASGVSRKVASDNMIRRVDKLGRYWAACTTMAKLASNAKYRPLFASIQLEPVPSYKTHIWPPGSDKKRHVHAEVQLVTHHRLHPSDLPPRVIGISKAACYLCDLFLSRHKQYYYSRSHGTIFDAWTVPDLLEYSSSDLAELRQTMGMMNQKLVTAITAMRRPKSKRQAAPKQSAYQSFIWSNPYQASTPPLSTRDDHSLAGSPRIITPVPAGPSVHTPPSLLEISQDEGYVAENVPIQAGQAESQNQLRSAVSSCKTIAPTTSTHTAAQRDSNEQNLAKEDKPMITSPLPEGNCDTIVTAEPSPEPKPSPTTNSEPKTLAPTDHIKVCRPPESYPQLPHEHSYAATPSENLRIPTANASTVHSLASLSASCSSEILISPDTPPMPKPINPQRPLYASLPGIDLYFSLEASSPLHVLPGPISGATVALTEMPSSAFQPLDVRSTYVYVAAMAPGEERVVKAETRGAGGGLVEMALRSGEGGGGVRVVCGWGR